jgi:predicted CxxxxCH...CXXCH cytochrome family protein
MSQIIKIWISGFLIVSGFLMVGGCGSSTPNDLAPFDSDSGTHASDWVYAKHASAGNENSDSCMECHGSDLAGGISGVPCSQCHLNGSPYTLTGCTSCHGNPPSGSAAPNRAGAHSAHNGLPNVTGVCSTCHQGAGSGTPSHDNGTVDVALLSAYNSKNGTIAHNADGTCSNVSCHGGQTTPVWLTGTINVVTQCTMCHSYGTTQYNSFSSGWHNTHVNTQAIACSACHDATKLAQNHFTSLNTTTMEGPAAATIGGLVSSYTGTIGTCTTTCHVSRQWFNPNVQP